MLVEALARTATLRTSLKAAGAVFGAAALVALSKATWSPRDK